jgi:DNA repair protein RecO (recombination protein O)
MDRFQDEALVLGTVDFGEADRVVTLFTRGHGRLSAFAAGARRSKRRFAGALTAGTWLKASLATRRGDTLRLDEVSVVRAFHHLQDELPLIARALHCLELCRELTRDHQPHEALFDALTAYLVLLDDKQAGPTSLLKFELDALEHAGLRPRFDSCAVCGRAVGARPRFDAQAGGAVCEACAPGLPGSTFVPLAVLEALAGLQAGRRVPLPTELRARAREVLGRFLTHHLGRRLKSVDFMDQVGVD